MSISSTPYSIPGTIRSAVYGCANGCSQAVLGKTFPTVAGIEQSGRELLAYAQKGAASFYAENSAKVSALNISITESFGRGVDSVSGRVKARPYLSVVAGLVTLMAVSYGLYSFLTKMGALKNDLKIAQEEVQTQAHTLTEQNRLLVNLKTQLNKARVKLNNLKQEKAGVHADKEDPSSPVSLIDVNANPDPSQVAQKPVSEDEMKGSASVN